MATTAPTPPPAAPRYDPGALKRVRPLVVVLEAGGVRLRPAGRGTFWALCPFHQEAEASFFVDVRDPEDEHFHCFGACRAHGDVIDFVRRREGVGFAEACARLAGAAAPWPVPVPKPLPVQGPAGGRRTRQWDRLTLEEQEVMDRACALYRRALWREPRALAYARGRGLPDRVIRRCGLGYADGHSLEADLRAAGPGALGIAEALGLLRAPGRGGHGPGAERLAGRIVVPELRGGRCLWMIGRAPDGPRGPKYVALPGERPVLGYERAAGRREAILCEGVFDWLTAVAWDLPAFSPCGTSLPADRLGFLAPARTVYGVLDGDAAGRAAEARFAAQLGARFRPLRLPAGSDLNDLGRRPDGRALFHRLLGAARRRAPREAGFGEVTG